MQRGAQTEEAIDSLDIFSDEVLLYIMSFLGTIDLDVLKLVSRRYNVLANDDSLKKDITLSDVLDRISTSNNIARVIPKIRESDIYKKILTKKTRSSEECILLALVDQNCFELFNNPSYRSNLRDVLSQRNTPFSPFRQVDKRLLPLLHSIDIAMELYRRLVDIKEKEKVLHADNILGHKPNASMIKARADNISESRRDLARFLYERLNRFKKQSVYMNLSGFELNGLTLENLSFQNANFENANISESNCYNSNFTYCNFESTKLHDTTFIDADLSFAKLNGTVFYFSNSEDADVRTHRNLNNAKFIATLPHSISSSNEFKFFEKNLTELQKYLAGYSEVLREAIANDISRQASEIFNETKDFKLIEKILLIAISHPLFVHRKNQTAMKLTNAACSLFSQSSLPALPTDSQQVLIDTLEKLRKLCHADKKPDGEKVVADESRLDERKKEAVEYVKKAQEAQPAPVRHRSRKITYQLHTAIREDDFLSVCEIAERGVDVNAKDQLGMTPAFLAVQKNSLKILEILIAKGANIDDKLALPLPELNKLTAGCNEKIRERMLNFISQQSKPSSWSISNLWTSTPSTIITITSVQLAEILGHEEIIARLSYSEKGEKRCQKN